MVILFLELEPAERQVRTVGIASQLTGAAGGLAVAGVGEDAVDGAISGSGVQH